MTRPTALQTQVIIEKFVKDGGRQLEKVPVLSPQIGLVSRMYLLDIFSSNIAPLTKGWEVGLYGYKLL